MSGDSSAMVVEEAGLGAEEAPFAIADIAQLIDNIKHTDLEV